MRFHVESDIAKPPSAVFAFLREADVAATASRQLGELLARVPFVRAEVSSELTGFEPSCSLEYDFSWKTPVARIRGKLRYLFEPGPLGTHLTQEQTLEPEGLLRVLSPLMSGALRKWLEGRMRALKATLERR